MATNGFSPTSPPTRAGVVAAELRKLIRGGDLQPGTRLRQKDIADRFGVSTTPVREAFVTLAREGLVQQDDHRGVRVFTPSAEELAEVYEMRQLLEPQATRIAAKEISSEALAELERIVEEMKTADAARYAELNHELHSQIYSAANRPRLLRMIESLREAAAGYLLLTVPEYAGEYREQAHHEHEEIVYNMRNGTPAAAARAMSKHLAHSAANVRSLFGPSD
jgi:DNA-binding GntR family transcriptional regulator